jgi:RNA polymerase sigma-70 factor (ECF subfamily)
MKTLEQELSPEFMKKAANWAFLITHDREDAEDLLSETLLRVTKYYPTFKQESTFTTWFSRIMKNAHIDAYRYSTLRYHLDALSLDNTGESDEYNWEFADPNEVYDAINFNVDLERALAEIEPEFAEVLILTGIQGYSLEEASAITGKPVGTMKSRSFRAREALSNKLNKGATK